MSDRYSRHFIRIGDDLALVVDPALLRDLGIDDATALDVRVEDGGIVIRPTSSDGLTAGLHDAVDATNERYADDLRRLAE